MVADVDRGPRRRRREAAAGDEHDGADQGDAGAIDAEPGQFAQDHPDIHEEEDADDDEIQLVTPALDVGARRRGLQHPFDGLGNEHLVVTEP